MIRAIIFDIGGVVMFPGTMFEVRERLAPFLGVTADQSKEAVMRAWQLWKTGKIDADEFFKRILNDLNLDKSVKKLKEMTFATNSINKDILPILQDLRKNYKIIAITNHAKEWFEDEIRKFNVDSYFDYIVTSYEAGIAKPEPKIYHMALDKYDLMPNECIFVDNMERNTIAAEKLGIKSIIFTSAVKLKKQLAELGVKLS